MNPVFKNILLGTIALLCVGGGIWYYVNSGKQYEYPDTAESRTTWMCEACANVVQLTAKQLNAIQESPDRVRRGDNAVDRKQTVIKCDKCGKFTICRAIKCPQHGVLYIKQTSDGVKHDCAKCEEEMRKGG